MTCVVAIMTKTGYMLGADSHQGSEHRRRIKQLPNSKLVRVGRLLIGCAGLASISTAIEFDKPLASIVVPKRCSKKTIHHIMGGKIMPRLKRLFAAQIPDEKSGIGELLLATGQHLFHIQLDRGFYWGRISPTWAIGWGTDFALGSIYTSFAVLQKPQHSKGYKRVLTLALQAAERFCTTVKGPFVFDET